MHKERKMTDGSSTKNTVNRLIDSELQEQKQTINRYVDTLMFKKKLSKLHFPVY